MLCVHTYVQKAAIPKTRLSPFLAHKGTVGGIVCKYATENSAMVCSNQAARQFASATYSRDGVICMWPELATKKN